jgi:hypothetical protein
MYVIIAGISHVIFASILGLVKFPFKGMVWWPDVCVIYVSFFISWEAQNSKQEE